MLFQISVSLVRILSASSANLISGEHRASDEQDGRGDGRASRHPSRGPASLHVARLRMGSGEGADWFHEIDRLI
jgi:hypothetical protein